MFRVILIILFLTQAAFAHKLNVLAVAENGSLTITSYFPDGRACKNCGFKVTDPDGKVIAEGKLDAEGTFFKESGVPDEMTVSVDAGYGHRAEEKIKAEGEININEGFTEPTGAADTDSIRKVVRQELAKQTTEIRAELDKHKSSLDMIIAGIGYIFGIFGIITLLRKK